MKQKSGEGQTLTGGPHAARAAAGPRWPGPSPASGWTSPESGGRLRERAMAELRRLGPAAGRRTRRADGAYVVSQCIGCGRVHAGAGPAVPETAAPEWRALPEWVRELLRWPWPGVAVSHGVCHACFADLHPDLAP